MRLKHLVLFLAVLCAGVGDVTASYTYYFYLPPDAGPVHLPYAGYTHGYSVGLNTTRFDSYRGDSYVSTATWCSANASSGNHSLHDLHVHVAVPYNAYLSKDEADNAWGDSSLNPDNKDTDGDGVSDKDEIANGTDPNESGDNVPVGGGDFLPDKDRDGTPDKYDPQPDVPNDDYDRHEMVDSDGDGYTNGQETAFGSSPFNPNSTPRNPDMDPPDPDPEEPPPDPDGDNDGAQDFVDSDEADYFNNKFNLIREELTTSRNVTKNWLTVLHDDAGDLKNALSAIEDSIREGNAGEGGSGDEDNNITVNIDNSDVVNALGGNSLSGSAGNSGYDANGEVSDGDGIQADSEAILNNVAPSEEQQDGIIAKIRSKLSSFLTIQLPNLGKQTSLSLQIPSVGSIEFPTLDFDLENYPIVEMVRTGELILLCILFAFSCLKTIRWAVS